MVTELAVLGAPTERDAVRKFLRVVPERYDQVAISIETCLQMEDLTIEDVSGRLKAAEDRYSSRAVKTAAAVANAKLLLAAQEERALQLLGREAGEGSSAPRNRGGRGIGRGRSSARGRGGGGGGRSGSRRIGKDQCLNCGELGHWVRDCKQPRREHAHLTQEDDDDGPALLMAHICALHDDVEEEASRGRVELDEPRAQVYLGEEDVGDNDTRDKLWFMDSGASNHMTGERGAFSELDTGVIGTVKFGDGSRVEIRGRGSIIFKCQNDEHRALTDVYYIPKLRSNIISLGQLDERGCRVMIGDGVLRVHDTERNLLAKVKRSTNRCYKVDLQVTQPVCLAAHGDDEAWLWHARFGHLSFDALKDLARHGMVRGLPRIEHAGELCDSCLAGKQRCRSFPRKVKYRAEEVLELVDEDLCGPITPATHGGRRFFLLLVDDYSRYMWLHLLSSKAEAAAAIRQFKAKVETETGKKLKVLRLNSVCIAQKKGCKGTSPRRTRRNKTAWWSGATKQSSGWPEACSRQGRCRQRFGARR
jgi:hypothetical protein